MKPKECWCGRAPGIHSVPASRDGQSVATIIQCPAHIEGQVSIYGANYGAVHRAVIVAWNDYQDSMAAMRQDAAA